jgi:hypothetical protein
MKRPSNQTLITHSAQLRPVWSTGAAKCEYSKVQNGNLSRHQFDDSSGIFQARQRAVGR